MNISDHINEKIHANYKSLRSYCLTLLQEGNDKLLTRTEEKWEQVQPSIEFKTIKKEKM